MKVFAFHYPSNEFIGKFDIESLEGLQSEFAKFTNANQVKAYDYLECSNRSWTVVEGSDGFLLQQGRHYPASDSSNLGRNPRPLNELLKDRYRTYRNASIDANGFAGFIMVIGWLLGAAIALFAFISAYPSPHFFTQIFPWLILATLVALAFHFFSLLLATLARLLSSSLDTAINTSQHLSDEEKIQSLRMQRSTSANTH